MQKKIHWNEEEIKYLIKNYSKIHSKEIGKFLNKDYKAIQTKANRLKLKGMNHKGKNNGNYKGGRWKVNFTKEIILSGKYDCPYCDHRGRVKEHQYVWWKKYVNDPILKGEVIHHKNFKRNDNRIKNLQKMKRSEHMKLHNKLNPNKKCFCNEDKKNFDDIYGKEKANKIRNKQSIQRRNRSKKFRPEAF
jgi:hypothetical protein